MDLARIDEHVYQLELQAYQTAFLDFKYEPPSFVSMEIKTSTRTTSATSFTFGPNPREQHVITKPINPIRGGTCLEIIPLPVITLIILVEVILELVTPSLVVSSGFEYLEFLFTTILLTPPQIGVGLEIKFQYILCMR
jgi:hypothetical protein